MNCWDFFREHMAHDLFHYGLCQVHIDHDDWYEYNKMYKQLHDMLITMDMQSNQFQNQKYITWYIKSNQ